MTDAADGETDRLLRSEIRDSGFWEDPIGGYWINLDHVQFVSREVEGTKISLAVQANQALLRIHFDSAAALRDAERRLRLALSHRGRSGRKATV